MSNDIMLWLLESDPSDTVGLAEMPISNQQHRDSRSSCDFIAVIMNEASANPVWLITIWFVIWLSNWRNMKGQPLFLLLAFWLSHITTSWLLTIGMKFGPLCSLFCRQKCMKAEKNFNKQHLIIERVVKPKVKIYCYCHTALCCVIYNTVKCRMNRIWQTLMNTEKSNKQLHIKHQR